MSVQKVFPLKFADRLARLFAWRLRHISDEGFLLLTAVFVGVLAGFAAVFLKSLVHYIQHSLTSDGYYWYFFPIVGLGLTALLGKLFKEDLGHGITDILYSILKKSAIIGRIKIISRMLTGALTVGFGGSAGLESPIVMTGAAIGSNVAGLFSLNYKSRTTLIGCGVAGVVSAIFNAPVAGVIFAVEIILADVAVINFIPLLIASVSAKLVSMALLGDEVLFTFTIRDTFEHSDVPFCLLLAVLSAPLSLFFTYIIRSTEHFFSKINNKVFRIAVGGLILSLIIMIFPSAYGEGYGTITDLLNNYEFNLFSKTLIFDTIPDEGVFLIYVCFILIFKIIATGVTIGAGGSGGIFAPGLFVGAMWGFVFARAVNLSGYAEISESNFALFGMCALMSGVQYTPLSAIFLMAELTGGYTFLVPFMLISAITYTTVLYFRPHSIYTRELIRRGDLVTGSADKKVLSKITPDQLIEKDLETVKPDDTLLELIEAVKKSRRNIFPVVDAKGRFRGVIYLDDVRNIMFEPDEHDTKLFTLMRSAPSLVREGENMQTVMNRFDRSDAWSLPVVTKAGNYVGFLSKSRIFNSYRSKLSE